MLDSTASLNDLGFKLSNYINLFFDHSLCLHTDYEAYLEIKRLIYSYLEDVFGDVVTFNIDYEDTVEAINITDTLNLDIYLRLYIKSYTKHNIPTVSYEYEDENSIMLGYYYNLINNMFTKYYVY